MLSKGSFGARRWTASSAISAMPFLPAQLRWKVTILAEIASPCAEQGTGVFRNSTVQRPPKAMERRQPTRWARIDAKVQGIYETRSAQGHNQFILLCKSARGLVDVRCLTLRQLSRPIDRVQKRAKRCQCKAVCQLECLPYLYYLMHLDNSMQRLTARLQT